MMKRTFIEGEVEGKPWMVFDANKPDAHVVRSFEVEYGWKPLHVLRYEEITLAGPCKLEKQHIRVKKREPSPWNSLTELYDEPEETKRDKVSKAHGLASP